MGLRAITGVLAFAAVVEIGTGVAMMAGPAMVVRLLLGVNISGAGAVLGRCFGIALVALGMACWPSGRSAAIGEPAFPAMLTYNTLIAVYLAYVGISGHSGLLLWPAVALHAPPLTWFCGRKLVTAARP